MVEVLVGGEGMGSHVDPRALAALSTPLIGQFDPAFTRIMDEVAELGRRAFQSRSGRCVPVSGLPEAALEAVLNTLLEDGDRVVAVGSPGEALAQVAERYGATVETASAQELAARLERQPARLVIVAHVEPATGVLQPLAELARVCHAHGALLLVDASLTLGGCELRFDAWGLDAAVAGLEACLGGAAGLSLTVFSAQVEAAFSARQKAATTSYLDLLQLAAYWSPERLNHHTAPTSLVYAARETLRLALLEGLEARWARHQQIASGLRAGLRALGLTWRGDAASLLCVLDPPYGELLALLREEYGVVLGARGQIALIGENARLDRLLGVLASLEQALIALGRAVTPGAARSAALGV